jgi:hypothetical protein
LGRWHFLLGTVVYSPPARIMANFSTAFGYKTYFLPLTSDNVDTTFADAALSGGGIIAAIGAGPTNFLDTTATVSKYGAGATNFLTGDTVTFDTALNEFDVDSVTYTMDGLDGDHPASLIGLTNAALETDTTSEEVITYDDTSLGFAQTIATGKSWSVSLAGVADFNDGAYKMLRLTELNTVASDLRVKFVRVGPGLNTETLYGYGTITNYSEAIEAGSIVSWEATLEGYGPYRLITN